MERRKKALLITNIPTPYRIPLFNEIRRQLDEKGWDFKVIFAALGYKRRKWEVNEKEIHFEYRILNSRFIKWRDAEKMTFFYSGLYRVLREEKPEVIVTNAFSPATFKLWWRSIFRITSYIIWSGGIIHQARKEMFLRRWYRKLLVCRAHAFIAYGTLAKECLVSLGADPKKVKIAINTVDTEFFSKETQRLRQSMPEDKVRRLLCVSYLYPRKQVDLMIHAISEFSKKRKDFLLEVIGDGPEMENLKKLVEELQMTSLVRFSGYKQKNEIFPFFARAFCFLFPTQFDVWGLTLIEAMAAGLPCLASIHAGAVHDMLPDDSFGFAVNFADIQSIVNRLDWLFSNTESARKIGENARHFVEECATIQNSATSFVSSVINY